MAFEFIKSILMLVWLGTWFTAIWIPLIRIPLFVTGLFALILALLTVKGEELENQSSTPKVKTDAK